MTEPSTHTPTEPAGSPALPTPTAAADPRRRPSRRATVIALGAVTVALLVVAVVAWLQSADEPPAGEIWFGSSFDAETFALGGRTTTIAPNRPFAYFAHLTRRMAGADLILTVAWNGAPFDSTKVDWSGTGDLWGGTLGGVFSPGEWRYSITDGSGEVLATGTFVAR